MEAESDTQMKQALSTVREECLRNPDKRKVFIQEGTIELLLDLCDSKKSDGVKACAAALMALLCHQNNSAKAKIIGYGGSKTLLALTWPSEDNTKRSIDVKLERLLAHQQSAAVLQKLSYKNATCQTELVNAGVIRHLIQLCNVFNPSGVHCNCCQVAHRYSKKANQLFSDLTMSKKLIGKINCELIGEERERKTECLAHLLGAEMSCLHEELDHMYSVDLYDTTTDKDIQISTELKMQGLVWPDLSCNEELEKQSPSKEARNTVWSDICLKEVIDAGHFWAHVGGESVKKNINEIQTFLNSQEPVLYSGIPHQGDKVGAMEIVNGNKTIYRARILDVSSADQILKAKVFAMDFGFTAIVPAELLFVLPKDLDIFSPQISLCALSGVQAPPRNTAVLEYAAGALRNLSEANADYISFISSAGGIEALLKLCSVPDKKILLQVLATLMNLSLDFRFRARIGFLGGIKILLAVGILQNILVGTSVNRSRVADAHGLAILVHVYLNTTMEEVKSRVLRALKNLIGKTSGDEPMTNPKNMLDITGVMDVNPTRQKRFSMSIPKDYDETPHARRPSRRRRRRPGLIDPKPTDVSLSLDCIEKSASDGVSDSESSSDDCYAGRWTSETDGDTDGEMLIKDSRTTKLPSYSTVDTGRSAHDKYYVQTHHMAFIQDETHEFSSQSNVHDISKKKIAKTLCAFLNNKKCGTIFVGVRSNAEISGVRVMRKERDLLRLGLDEMVECFKPPILHDMYRIDFIPVVRPSGSESVVTRMYVEDRFIIEITLLKFTGFVYTTQQGKCYFRHKSANIELTTQEIREQTIHEQEVSYNAQIKRLRKEIKGMRKQLTERPQCSDSSTLVSMTTPESTNHGQDVVSCDDKSVGMRPEHAHDDSDGHACVVM